jgi:prepilin-type processing-associated H-X9-DG protein
MIGEVLAPYGIGPDVLRCPTDAKGKNYHALEGTSYEWRPLVDGEPITAVMMYMRFGTFSVSPSRVRMVTDYEGVHRGKQNRLYADGHVVGH